MSQANRKVERLRHRAVILRAARQFFEDRRIIEVDCPLLSVRASIDPHIDLISALYGRQEKCYLHSSPEYGMKRLLAEGIGDIYQLSHVFRDGEFGIKHNPEFMMAEWYRLNFTLEEMIQETADFIRAILGPRAAHIPCRTISYREAFQNYLGVDYWQLSEKQLLDLLNKNEIPVYPEAIQEGVDGLLNLLLGMKIEPLLGHDELTILAYYPASQAALAKKRRHGSEEVAERFEIYYKGIELANGYHELSDASEQRRRLLEANEKRSMLGKEQLPVDEYFLKALEKGLPDCCGVAVGFDRCVMLSQNQKRLGEVIPWEWSEA